MNDTQQNRLEVSNSKFSQAWEMFNEQFGGGEIHSVEKHAHPTLKLLDTNAGIDWLWFQPDGTVKGIAARVNYTPYCTFTLRKHSEWPKYQAAIANNGYLPSVIINVYYEKGQLHSVGMIETEYLVKIINLYIAKGRQADITRSYWDHGGTERKRYMWSVDWRHCAKAKLVYFQQ